MLSDREIADLWSWAAAQDQGPETTQQHAFARAVERAAYERAAQECEAQISGSDYQHLAWHGHWDLMAQSATNCADAIRALGEQHD